MLPGSGVLVSIIFIILHDVGVQRKYNRIRRELHTAMDLGWKISPHKKSPDAPAATSDLPEDKSDKDKSDAVSDAVGAEPERVPSPLPSAASLV